MGKKSLYFECYSGISGDMTVGALLDLGADPQVLKKSLDSLEIDGYQIHIGRTKKCGIDACDFDVEIPDQPEYDEGHMHHHHDEEEEHEHHHHHDDEEEHEHEHHHHHDEEEHEHHHHHDEAGHDHDHHHHHVHRNIHDVFAVIDRLDNEHAKEIAKKIFMIVAEAESKAHGIPIDEVHFHEVGAIDSIVDIVAAAVCIDNLGIDDIIISDLYEGSGHVHCAHGQMPVPVPATANIAAANDLHLKITDARGEMVTPTGAAIAAALRTSDTLPADYSILRIGLGAGKKDFPRANVLRVMMIESRDNASARDELWVLESNIDDSTGEMLGHTLNLLMEAGARDAWFSPIFMKKNRPAYMLSVLCCEDKLEELEGIIFRETTTIGIRRHSVERTILSRRPAAVSTPYGDVTVKVCGEGSRAFAYPEYDSVEEVSRRAGVPFKTVYRAACAFNIKETED